MIKLYGYLKVFEKLGFVFHSKMIKRYNECWIPDVERKDNLSGNLSHKYKLRTPHKFIGPLSRFQKDEKPVEYENKYCIILSGPEPNRSILERMMLDKFSVSKDKTLIIRGIPGENMQFGYGNMLVYSHMTSNRLEETIKKSEYIICRSGYTSIMDLYVLNKKALMIPTPNQPEQEYLAKFLNGKHLFKTISEKKFEKLTVEEVEKIFG